MSSPQPYYVPESSKLPFAMAVTMLTLIFGAATTVNPELGPFGENSYLILLTGFLMMWTTMFFWFSQVIKENNEGLNNNMLKQLLLLWNGLVHILRSNVLFRFLSCTWLHKKLRCALAWWRRRKRYNKYVMAGL